MDQAFSTIAIVILMKDTGKTERDKDQGFTIFMMENGMKGILETIKEKVLEYFMIKRAVYFSVFF